MSEKGRKSDILETRYIPSPIDTECPYPKCPVPNNVIKKGVLVFESPSVPGYFYHTTCFRQLVSDEGKDPNTYIKYVVRDPKDKPRIH